MNLHAYEHYERTNELTLGTNEYIATMYTRTSMKQLVYKIGRASCRERV